ncbi:hypothetical protein NQ315_015720 [Exocentrus adspersus]|uniref:Uncharacterized protein n=1 Tax=Exocentrus adspersus TaxID=1586481 RepID=A0AAV8W2P0_9CUCU|nr:hypothetical protein NQ315_015720 [Exocentrus adspersus]
MTSLLYSKIDLFQDLILSITLIEYYKMHVILINLRLCLKTPPKRKPLRKPSRKSVSSVACSTGTGQI